MDLPAFYVPEFEKGILELPESEAHHAIKVLRMNKDDSLFLLDGKGKTGIAKIEAIIKRKVTVSCSEVQEHPPQEFKIHLAIAPTKKWDRMAFLLEKLTEIGLSEFTPLICHNSEQRFWKDKKAQQVAISALKQSRNPFLPKLNDAIKFNDFISANNQDKLIAHCKAEYDQQFITSAIEQKEVCILIGPEGDFTSEELNLAMENKSKSITLGKQRMRTETAGLYSTITTFNYFNFKS